MIEQLPDSFAVAEPRPEGKRWFAPELLQLFETFDRKEFRAAFGRKAPPVDLDGSVLKGWWDTDAGDLDPEGVYRYTYAGQLTDGTATMLTAEISNALAATVNIPGKYDYPAYGWAPTDAFIASIVGNWRQLIPAERLSSFGQAERILAQIQEDIPGYEGTITQSKLDGNFFKYIYEIDDPDDTEGNFIETRRLWQIGPGAGNVGRMLRKMNRSGRGAPGRFMYKPGTDTKDVVWLDMIDLEEEIDTLPWLPAPCRELAPDEKLIRRSPFDQGTVEVTTAPNPNEVEVKGGGDGGKDGVVYRLLVKLATALGVTPDD